MKDDVFQSIKSQTKLRHLDLSMKDIGDDDIEQVIKAIIEHKPQLRELHLDSNHLSDRGAQSLAKHLRSLDELTLLSIQFNQIDRNGAEFIFNVRDTLSELEILFHGNKIKDAGIMHDIEHGSRSSPPRLI